MMKFVIWIFAIWCLIGYSTAASENSSDSGESKSTIGDFVFEKPDDKGEVEYAKAGGYYRIIWSTRPTGIDAPDTVKLEWRRGRWPEVSDWTVIDEAAPNEDYYDWNIPENMAPDYYIFRISTEQKRPLIRTRTSQLIRIYQGRSPINGEIILPTSGATHYERQGIWSIATTIGICAASFMLA